MFKIIAALVANFVAMAVLSGCATPAIAAWSVVSTLQNIVSPIVF